MGINQQLKELYSSKWDKLINNGNEQIKSFLISKAEIIDIDKDIYQIIGLQCQKCKDFRKIPANPLLLKVNEEEYENSDLKVMIFGQETYGWHRFGTKLSEEMDKYMNFFNYKSENIAAYKGSQKSSFWKAFKWFRKNINKHFDDKNIYYLWNNISKIGSYMNETGVPKNIRELERNFFNHIIVEELKILKPDIVIFFIGNRDDDLKFNFPNAIFENIPMNNTKKMKRKYKNSVKINLNIDFLDNTKAVKLYHPSYCGGYHYIKQDAIEYILQ